MRHLVARPRLESGADGCSPRVNTRSIPALSHCLVGPRGSKVRSRVTATAPSRGMGIAQVAPSAGESAAYAMCLTPETTIRGATCSGPYRKGNRAQHYVDDKDVFLG
jgi:hypothetical protein